MPELIWRRRPAMGTLFEVALAGADESHRGSAGELALDEVSRLESQLSRFDPASEISRINRDAFREPVRVDMELWGILADCLRWCELTGGAFDVSATSGNPQPLTESLLLVAATRSVRFLNDIMRLDLGGYGKGLALDAAAAILREYGIERALLHGGGSSVLALGTLEDESPWRIGLRDPFTADGPEVAQVLLTDQGFSSSAVFHPGDAASDIFDPHTQARLQRAGAVCAIAPTAREAEVLSTAFLVMGRERMVNWLRDSPRPGIRAGWLEQAGEVVSLEWGPPYGLSEKEKAKR